MELNYQKLNKILQRLRANPYKIYKVTTPHTGYLRELKVKEGDEVKGPSGKWLEKPGTPLFVLERERNLKTIRAKINGTVQNLRTDLLNCFVEAEETILEIRHPLSQQEVISEILLHALYIIKAPETARYILSPEIAKRLEKEGTKKVRVRNGDELMIMTFMKRETPIFLEEEGEFVLYQVYFNPFELVEAGKPLLGLCPEKDLPYLEKIISRIKQEWD